MHTFTFSQWLTIHALISYREFDALASVIYANIVKQSYTMTFAAADAALVAKVVKDLGF